MKIVYIDELEMKEIKMQEMNLKLKHEFEKERFGKNSSFSKSQLGAAIGEFTLPGSESPSPASSPAPSPVPE